MKEKEQTDRQILNEQDYIKEFLKKSAFAENMKLKPQIILNRQKMTLKDIHEIQKQGIFHTNEIICELGFNGYVIGTGKISEKNGQLYFKLTEKNEIEDQGGLS